MLLALGSLYLLAQIEACPLCPVIAAAAATGGLSQGNTLVAIAAAEAAFAPLTFSFLDSFRTKNMTFDFPKEGSIYQAGTNYGLYMNTFGLSSQLHTRTSNLYLLNSTFDRVALVSSDKEFKTITNISYSHGMPKKGFGYMNWTVPDLPTGRYYLKYKSGWTIWPHEGEFAALSPPFIITSAYCLSAPCPVLSTPSPTSFTAKTAPIEIQFLYSHWNGPVAAVEDVLNGVIDVPVAIARGTVKAVLHPVDAAKGAIRAIRHPMKSARETYEEFEEKLEKEPFRATGEAIGLAAAISLPIRALGPLSDPIVEACDHGACSHHHH